MVELKECTRTNLCVDCDNTECLHKGKIMSDCPKYYCDNYKLHDCEHCDFIKSYIKEYKKYLSNERNKRNG